MLECDDRFAPQNHGGPPPEFPLTLFEHSSPSFGSHRTPSDRDGAESATVRRRCAAHLTVGGSRLIWVHFRCASQDWSDAAGIVRESLSLGRRQSAVHPRRVGASGTSVDEGDSLRVHWTAGDDGRRDGRRDSSVRVRIHLAAHRSAPPVKWAPAAWAWICTVSRTVEVSFQSSFQLSLMVLVRYRSRVSIEPWMESTTRLWAAIPNNPTLGRRSSGSARRALAHGVLTLSDAPFQETRTTAAYLYGLF